MKLEQCDSFILGILLCLVLCPKKFWQKKEQKPSIQTPRGMMDEDETKEGYESNMISQGGAESDSDDDLSTLVEDGFSDDDEPVTERRYRTRQHQGDLPICTSHIQFPLYLEPLLLGTRGSTMQR
jgi:hypothetical protein